MNDPLITLSDNAVAQLKELIRERAQTPGEGLRISVDKGGCSGLQYQMTVATRQPGDLLIGSAEAPVFVAADSVEVLRGCAIDYDHSLTSAGFKIRNPNAVRTCGCGTSFEASPLTS
ncbi:MAG: iron-sulfur cluster assembly accessory protein [Verrucomicrobiia bacterium]